ncbi:MAG: UDP-glucose 4-epimerase [Chlamydiales bacterium]|nr:UDP-glucose 4-epimerase [Chlamydiales bacterium]
MKIKKIIVTGGAGFVGSHLCHALLEQGHAVYCVDNFYTGSRAHLDPRVELIEQDICTQLHLEVDEIYNLACPASPVHYQNDPVQTTKTSVIGAIQLLELAKKHNAKILQASTSEVYGDPLVHPQVETYWGHVNPIGIRACYDEGKRCAETLFFDYHRQYHVPIRAARIFNTYGPHMHPNDGRVVSNFIVQALHNHPLTIYGKGTQTRSFCFVSDLVDGLIKLMESETTGPINLGNPIEFTMLELANLILDITQSQSQLVHSPLPSDDPKQRKPDITLAQKILNWHPTIPLEEGLKTTIAYFKKLFLTV